MKDQLTNEQQKFLAALVESQGNVSGASKDCGINKSKHYRWKKRSEIYRYKLLEIIKVYTQKQQENNGETDDKNAHLKRIGFQSGKSGNPSGRPKGTPNLSTIYKKMLSIPLVEDSQVVASAKRLLPELFEGKERVTYADLIAANLLKRALSGGKDGLAAIKEIADRTEGKALQQIKVDEEETIVIQDADKLSGLDRDDKRKMLELLRKAKGAAE